MAILNTGKTFGGTETVTSAKLAQMVNSAAFRNFSDATVAYTGSTGTCLQGGGLEVTTAGQLQIANTGVNTAEIADDAITAAKIADDAVGAAAIANNAINSANMITGEIINTGNIVGDAVTQAKIADDAVGADQLASNSVVTASIVDLNVNAAKIANATITDGKIVDDTITSSKLSFVEDSVAVTAGKILVADGSTYDAESMSGDATIAAGGALTIANDAVTAAKTSFLGTVDVAANSTARILSKQSDGEYDGVTPSGDVTMSQAGAFTISPAITLSGSAPSITLDDTGNSGTSPTISSDNNDGDLLITAGKANAEVEIKTGNGSGTGTTRLQAGELVAKNNAGSADEGIKVTGSIYATVDIVADGDVVADLDSDERLKNNITPIKDPLEKVNELSGNTFSWNEKSHKDGDDVGVIAQEVQRLFPSAVRVKDNGFLKVDYVRLIPVLIESIKVLSQKVQDLEDGNTN